MKRPGLLEFVVAGPWCNDSSDCLAMKCPACGVAVLDSDAEYTLDELLTVARSHVDSAHPKEFNDEVSDGFGSSWVRCGSDCDLHVVRPGSAQCNNEGINCLNGPQRAVDQASK